MLLFLDRVFKSVPSEGWKGATVYPRCLSLRPEDDLPVLFIKEELVQNVLIIRKRSLSFRPHK